jgi:CheY-like chemotaxis protein
LDIFGKTAVHVLALDERIREAARALDPSRFTVAFSSNRAEAIAAVDSARPDIVVIDLVLGGFDVARDLRARPHLDVKLVMFCDRPHDKWLCRQAGAQEVIVKPLADLDSLLQAVESAMKTSSPLP